MSRRAVEAVALAGLLACLLLLLAYPGLPERVPHHYGAAGVPDAWGPKSIFLVLPLLALVQYGLLSVLGWGLASGETAGAAALLGWVKVELVWLLAYLEARTIQVAHGAADGLGAAFLPVVVVVLVGTVAWHAWRLRGAAGQQGR